MSAHVGRRLAAAAIGLLALLVVGFADVKINNLPSVTTLHSDDLLMDVDVHDTSSSLAGTAKKLTVSQLYGSPSNGELLLWNNGPARAIVGSGLSVTGTSSPYTISATGGGGGGSGTVTSVDLTVPSWLAVGGNPITTSGTLAVTAATGQAANRVLATPNGSSGAVSLRAIAAADLPAMVASGASHAAGAVPDPGSTAGTSRFLREDATWAVPPAGGAGGSPGGSPGQLQYNNAGSFAGAANLLISSNSVANVGAAIADPGTYVAGDLWPSSASGGLKYARAAGLGGNVPLTIFSCGSCAALTNFTTAASALASPSGVQGSLTIPANTLKVGTIIELLSFGKWGSAGTAPVYTVAVKLGGTTVLQSSPFATIAASQSNQIAGTTTPIRLMVLSTGATGSIVGYGIVGFVQGAPGSTSLLLTTGANGATTPATIDTTSALALDFQVGCSAASASNTYQTLGFAVHVFN